MTRSPNCGLGVGSTTGVLRAVGNSVEEQLITIANRPDIVRVRAPIEASNSGFMSSAFANSAVSISSIVDPDLGVVGANSKILAIRGVLGALNPLVGILNFFGDVAKIAGISNSKRTIISSNSYVTINVVDGDSSGGLRLSVLTKSGSSISLSFSLLRVNLSSVLKRSGGRVPADNLVIVTRGVDHVAVGIETPNLSGVVRLMERLH
jgi:hypothetical protein